MLNIDSPVWTKKTSWKSRPRVIKQADDPAEVLDECFDCIFQPGMWSGALDRLAASLNVACLMLYHMNPAPGELNPLKGNRPILDLPMSAGFRDPIRTYLQEEWYRHDHRAKRVRPLFDAGHVVVTEDHLSTAHERTRLKAFNEFYLRHGLPGFAAIALKVNESRWAIPLLRAARQGHFSEAETRRLERLAPQFRRLISLTEHFATVQATGGLDVLQTIASPAILLDWRGRVAQVNASAEALIGHGLNVVDTQLVATDRAGNQELAKMIGDAVSARRPSDMQHAKAVAIRRENRRPLIVDAVPSAGAVADVLRSLGPILLITDLDRRPNLVAERVAKTLGLTRAEARLAVELANGSDLRTAADNLSIGKETARSHLRSIFAKAGTNRQSQLLALLCRV